MKKSNFDLYLEEELRDPKFAERFKQAGEAWDRALQLAAQGEQTDLSPQQVRRIDSSDNFSATRDDVRPAKDP